ncbi:hypothetical protein AAHC03_01788 [Spirometra sp. Aus1]
MQILIDGTVSGYGVIFNGMLKDPYFLQANYTESQLALPGAIQACLFVTSIGLASPFVNLFGFRWVASIGGLLGGLSMAAGSQFKGIAGVIAFFGFFSGLGLGAVCICAMVSVTYYFEKYRGVASGIAAAGNGVGYILVPLVLSTLMEFMDWRKSVLVYALITASVFFSAAIILRPIEVDLPSPDEMADLEEKQSLLQFPVSNRSRQVSLAFADVGAALRMLEPIQETEVEAGLASETVPGDLPVPDVLTNADPEESAQKISDLLKPTPSTKLKPEPGDLGSGASLIFSSVPVLPSGAIPSRRRGGGPHWPPDPLSRSKRSGDTSQQDLPTATMEAKERRDDLLEYLLYNALAGRQISTEQSSEEPYQWSDVFVSNPDGLNKHRLKPSHMHTDVNLDSGHRSRHGSRRRRKLTMTLMPMDRPDSLYTASMTTLAWHDHKISQVLPNAEEQANFLNALEKQTGLSNQLAPVLMNAAPKVSRVEDHDVAPSGLNSNLSLGGDISHRSSLLAESIRPPPTASPVVSFAHRLVRMFDLGLFTNPTFLVMATAFVFVQMTYFVPFVYLFGYSVENGLTRAETMIMTTVMGVLHILGRLAGGALANVPKVDILLLTIACYFLVSGCHIALPFLQPTFTMLTIYAGAFGFLCAVPCPLQPLLCVHYLGLDRLTMVLGNANLLKGVAAAVGPIVAGNFK